MAKQQGGLAYLIGLLVFVLVLVAPTQCSKDIKDVVHSAAAKLRLVGAKAEPAPEQPKPEPTPAPLVEPKPAPPAAPTPVPPAAPAPKAEPKPAPTQPAPQPAPKAEPKPAPAAPAPAPQPPPAAKPEPKPEPPKTAPPPAQPAPEKKEEKKAEPAKPKEDTKRQDGGGIGLPLAQEVPPAPAAQDQPAVKAEAGEGAIARLIDKIPSAQFTLADALVWIIFVLWVIKVIVYKELKLVRLFPLPILAFVVLAILSMIPPINRGAESIDKQSALKELIQYIEYFIVGYLILANNADTERTFKRIVRVLILASTIVIAIGVLQYASEYSGVKDAIAKLGPLSGRVSKLANAPDAMSIRGTFGNRNVFGAFLAIILPFLWGIALAHKRGFAIVTRIWMIVLTVAGLAIITSGGAMLAALTSILIITFIRDEKFFSIVLVIVLIVGLVLGLFLRKPLQHLKTYIPRQNLTMLNDSVKLFKAKDAQPPRNYGWQQRYVEWQAAINAMVAHPILGVGIGNYQQNINQYYGEIDKPAENYMEPDAMNGLLIIGVTMGLPGLLAFVWILFKAQKWGAMGFSLLRPGLAKGASLGIYGSVISVVIASMFTNVLVRGVGLVFIILLALAGQANDLMPDAAGEPEKKKEQEPKEKS